MSATTEQILLWVGSALLITFVVAELVRPAYLKEGFEIIQQGSLLGVDYAATVSCYQADDLGRACGVCDSCRLRSAGFAAAGVSDPTSYRKLS